MPNKLYYFIALVLGATLTLGYAPFNLWPIVPIAFTGFLYLLSRRPHIGGRISWCFGFGWFGAGISWVHVSIADFGGIPLIASIAMMALLSAYLALYPLFAGYLLTRFVRISLWPMLFPLLWVIAEWLRSWILTGFPWLSLGYSQLSGPLSGWLPIMGETGVSALLALGCCALAIGISQKRYMLAMLPALVIGISGLVLNQISWVQTTGKTAKISLVQGNIQQEMRWNPDAEGPTMDKYRQLTAPHWDSDIIIWPEAAIPRLEALATPYLLELDAKGIDTQTALIAGMLDYDFISRQSFNNLVVLGQQHTDQTRPEYYYQHPNRFSKHHLLPIGEFIPFEDVLRGLAPIFDLPFSSFTRGDYQQPNLEANGYQIAAAICFEIAFPRQVRANLNEHTDFILTVSNDAWFGHSHGPAQHLQIAEVRAKELGLPVLRATNNGITAVIDADGEIQARLPQFEAGVLSANVATVSGQTPYRNFGDTLMWLFSLLLTVVGWIQQTRLSH